MKLKIFGPNLRDQSKGAFVVHASTCKDCEKLRREHSSEGDYATELDVSQSLFSDMINEGSMTAEDGLLEIHFAPCTATLGK